MSTSGRRILVVDDDPWIAKMLEFVVTDAGHTAVVCKDGVDAVDKFAATMPDLVMVDVVLPRLDGLKVCEQIKRTPIGRLTPVLVFSGIYRDSTEALKFGADAFVAKPFTPQQVGALIKQLLPALPEPAPPDLAGPALKPAPGEVPLAREPLPRTLGRLAREGRTGVLTLRSRVGIKYLFFEKGNVVQVRSPATASGITTALLARGRVTPAQLENLEKTARESQGKKLLSGLLVETNLVKPEELRKLVLGQMLWEIFEAFRWREGLHAFAESPPLPASAGQYKLDVSTPHLVHWGVRRMDLTAADLDQLVPSRMSTLQRTPEAEAMLKPLLLTERDREILGLLEPKQGTKTLQEILSIAEMAGADAAPTLYTLLSLGAVLAIPPRDLPAQSAAPTGPRELQGPFANALMELWRGHETGVLRCASSLDNRVVYVSRGRPIFARSERNSERLDQMLVRAGTITPEQATRSLELQARTPHKRVGQILIEMGVLHLDALHASVKLQVQNLVLSLFTWAEGGYQFVPGPLPSEEAITLDWDTPGAVVQGLRGLPLTYIRPLAPPRDAVVERSPDEEILKELQLNSAERKLLELLVGRHPMEQLLALDFVSQEALIRGLVMFAALGLVSVQRTRKHDSIHIEPEGEGGGLVLDPFAEEPLPEPPAASAPPPPRPERVPPRFAGPALAAFEAGASTGEIAALDPRLLEGTGPHHPADEEEPGAPCPAEALPAGEDLEAQAAEFSALLSSPDGEGGFAPPSDDLAFGQQAPPSELPPQLPLRPPPPLPGAGEEMVPRHLYDALLAERNELQAKLLSVLSQQSGGAMVPRELFDQVQEEKRQAQEKLMQMMDELLRQRSGPGGMGPRRAAPVRPFPGGRKGEP